MTHAFTTQAHLPEDHQQATLVGRIWQPGIGPVLVKVQADGVYDLTTVAATSSQLLELDNPAMAVAQAKAPRLASLEDLLANADVATRDTARPWLLAPIDLQAVKASGVTFVASMLERVIEEQARGDAGKAESVRKAITAVIGDNLSSVVPGSDGAAKLKEVLLEQDVWSQYLEVGIGPDAEIFTKAQPLSSVGLGDEVGIHPKSVWNNPEPEIVLVVNSRGATLGATLGNDVNLRDFEGRSALLLGKAKDNNASCAVGPFIRLFDANFSIDDVRRAELTMRVDGTEGFTLKGSSSMSMISRDPLNLVEHAIGPNHQYPDGLVLFLGTMFAPTQDRFGPGQGFTHQVADVVTIATPKLGALVNKVNFTDKVTPWTFGLTALLKNLAQRKLI
ncbi:fumarylacetoacetate hydrolase [Herbaspirillum hiltneri N3]|uniref:Fumarylacetoacetate hydrolase n=1 Tax=Herbaspirillum hiltneri N3 TaxID=1262470 RepID=A0ABM5UWQ6_9BURK|nr:fumarylacetoacetate hydrolase family protein [Herbaspirillum hiltneri]AKZ61607.1 fumarylacetoacetate hydrolase [Herbaspirillum hiltneri N3]